MTRIKAVLLIVIGLTISVLTACGGSSNGATISGTLSGLNTGQSIVLQNLSTDTLTLSANGAFSFPTKIGNGNAYSVTIITQPTGQICVVSNGVGAVDTNGGSINNVFVTCTTASALGGTITGLAAGAAVTLSDGTVSQTIAANGLWAFPSPVLIGSPYTITITTQPAGQTCTLVNDTGTVTAASASNIAITCV